MQNLLCVKSFIVQRGDCYGGKIQGSSQKYQQINVISQNEYTRHEKRFLEGLVLLNRRLSVPKWKGSTYKMAVPVSVCTVNKKQEVIQILWPEGVKSEIHRSMQQ